MSSFAAEISEWVTEVKAYHEAVFHESAQRVTDLMNTPRGQGGNLPVDTGYLWHSLQASNSEMPKINPEAQPAKAASYAYSSGPIELVINGTELGQAIYLGYTAAYAARINYGFTGQDSLGRNYSQRGAMFVELAAQKWQSIVTQVEGELAARLGR
jgi:hypothetical protein